jgi:hypothetical protein
MKIQEPICKQKLMTSNAQLWKDDSDDEVPVVAAMPIGFPEMASSSQTVPSSEPEVNYSQIMEALAAIQGGMSNMQVSMSSMQQTIKCAALQLKSILEVSSKVRIPLKTRSGRRPGWEAFVLGYTSESKVRPLHRYM